MSRTGKTAVVFPGQGSQYFGMITKLTPLFAGSKIESDFKELVELSKEVLGYNPWVASEDEELLKDTKYTQPLIFITSAIFWNALKQKIHPDFVAGHSLGEYSAIYANEMMNFEKCLNLVKRRGELMAEAASISEGQGMWAIIGRCKLEIKQIQEVIDTAGALVEIANFNSPLQIILSGSVDDFEAIESFIKELDAVKRVIKLNVSGAFHSSFMHEANFKFSTALSRVEYLEGSSIPIVVNSRDYNTEDIYRPQTITSYRTTWHFLRDQMVRSVCWQQMVEYMLDQGVTTFIEAMPGKVLSGLIKKIADHKGTEVKIYNQDNIVEYLENLKSLTAT